VSKSGGLELRRELLGVVGRSGPDGGEEDKGVVSKVGEERSKEGSGEGGRSEGRVDDSVDEVGEVGDLLGFGGLGGRESYESQKVSKESEVERKISPATKRPTKR